ncbi:MAG: hypothetical protein K1X94_04845 [Sandaracinaceae bacterium]|nr:hypothetical protein [Sandaracinaceae bacterium]
MRASSAYEALAFHALTHLSLAPPRSLRDERYRAWSRAALPELARSPLAEDALAISRRIEEEGCAAAVQWLPRLHRSIEALRATARLELTDGAMDAHSDPVALRAMRARHGDGVEWLRADLLLAAGAFVEVHERVRVEPRVLTETREILASFAAPEVPPIVVLDHALGAHGRAFPEVVYVGAPAAWNGLDAHMPAVLALHEHAVRRAQGSFEEREWSALVRVERLVEPEEALRRAHAAWLVEASLEPLLDAARVRGVISASEVGAVISASDRSLALAQLRA